jgi:hypothetical protein
LPVAWPAMAHVAGTIASRAMNVDTPARFKNAFTVTIP